MAVYKNILAEAVKLGMTREQMAGKLGVSIQTFRNWISKRNAMPSGKLIELSRITGKSIDYLLEEYDLESEE